jgi:hypothetical protein
VLNFDYYLALHLLFCIIVVLRIVHRHRRPSLIVLSFVIVALLCIYCSLLLVSCAGLYVSLFIICVLRGFVLIALCYCPVCVYYLIPSSKMARPINPDDLLGNKLGWVKL